MADTKIVSFGSGAGLMSREQLGQVLNAAAAAIPAGNGGKQFLKISDKDGAWTYGAEETVVEEDSLWAVNPLSFFHGYIAWHDAKVEGEVRLPVTRPLPPVASLQAVQAQHGWQDQFGFDLICITGEDAGIACEYKASSTGGKRAVGALTNAINAQYAINQDAIVPIVRLRDNKYYDKKYKKDQFPPVFEIVEWRTMDDNSAPAAATDDKKVEAKAAAPASEPDAEEKALEAEYKAAAEAAQSGEVATPRRRLRR